MWVLSAYVVRTTLVLYLFSLQSHEMFFDASYRLSPCLDDVGWRCMLTGSCLDLTFLTRGWFISWCGNPIHRIKEPAQ
jgi:hypothetical protein